MTDNIENDDIELIHGTHNVFRDFGRKDADLEYLRAVLAAEIIKVLDRRKMSVRAAEEATGIAAADFSRVRKVKLDRFTIDRLMRILNLLGQEVDVTIEVHPKPAPKTATKRSSRRPLPAPQARDEREQVR